MIGVIKTGLLRLDTPDHMRAELFGRGVEVRIAGDSASYLVAARALPFVHSVAAKDGSLQVSLDDPDGQSPALVQALIAAGAQIRSVEPIAHSLEDVYMELVAEHHAEVKQ